MSTGTNLTHLVDDPQKQDGPRRSPKSGGYARGEEKRLKIIEAALRRFGEDGYEGTSTRQIAQEAGVNPPALQYYFDSKEGLYAACLTYIREHFSVALEDVFARATALQPTDRDAATEIFGDTLAVMAEFLFETSEVKGWRLFAARIKAKDGCGPYQSEDKQRFTNKLFGHLFTLAGIATGQAPEDINTRLRAFAAMGMLIVLHHNRDDLFPWLGWQELRGAALEDFKTMLRRQARVSLSPLI